LADHDAEAQLYAQTSALIKYLDQRQHSSTTSEFVVLIDDLYTRGFLERGDLQTAIEWYSLMQDGNPHSIIKNEFIPPRQKKQEVVAVLHINHNHIENIPLWMALHSHKFLSVRIYVPKSTHCHSICGLDIHCISEDDWGYFAYESIVHTIETTLVWPQSQDNIKGFLFLHDDIIWKSDIVFDRPVIAEVTQIHLSPDWYWQTYEMGLPALDKFRSKYNKQEIQAYHGQADLFFVPLDNAAQFAIMGRQMREMGVFLEIAVPTIMSSNIMKGTTILKLYSPFNEHRADPSHIVKTFYQEYDIAHPVKLTSMNGLLGQIDIENRI
jgi:hypothetical protein